MISQHCSVKFSGKFSVKLSGVFVSWDLSSRLPLLRPSLRPQTTCHPNSSSSISPKHIQIHTQICLQIHTQICIEIHTQICIQIHIRIPSALKPLVTQTPPRPSHPVLCFFQQSWVNLPGTIFFGKKRESPNVDRPQTKLIAQFNWVVFLIY